MPSLSVSPPQSSTIFGARSIVPNSPISSVTSAGAARKLNNEQNVDAVVDADAETNSAPNVKKYVFFSAASETSAGAEQVSKGSQEEVQL